MKKTLLATTIIASVLSSTVAFAKPDETVIPAQTTVHWSGSIADIIPGDNIIITGKGSSIDIITGNLNLEQNGTFASSQIVLETHEFDSITQIINNDLEAADWTLKNVAYKWGENDVTSSDVQVFDMNASSSVPLTRDLPITGVSMMSLQVKNQVVLDVLSIVDKTADALVDVTMIAAFPA